MFNQSFLRRLTEMIAVRLRLLFLSELLSIETDSFVDFWIAAKFWIRKISFLKPNAIEKSSKKS